MSQLHLAVALDGFGWHPAAWRTSPAAPDAVFGPRYWVEQTTQAAQGPLDFVSIEDSFRLQSDELFAADERTDRVRGRLDAELIAARVGPVTPGIGLIPAVTATHTEPFHTSKAIATLDYVTLGRAGVRIQVSGRPHEARLFGRNFLPPIDPAEVTQPDQIAQAIATYFGEAADYIEVVQRLWDSWEDGAEIRDAATGRFIDKSKLHYIDFEGATFAVRGPSITPRPPQGQPPVAVLAHQQQGYELIAQAADIGFITPTDTDSAEKIVTAIRAARADRPAPVRVFADLAVVLDDTAAAAQSRLERLNELAGTEFTSDAHLFVGTGAELADLAQQWQAAGVDGFRLRPLTNADDLARITGDVVPQLQHRGLFRTAYESSTLRGHLGLSRPANRYASAS